MLTIIGLLVAGILVGRDMIHAAEIRATIKQAESFNAAVNTFRLKYNCLPGDCAQASDFGFGGNGNGNSQVGEELDNFFDGFAERIGFWGHLQTAGLVQGKMIDIDTGGGGGYLVPKVKLNARAGWAVFACIDPGYCPFYSHLQGNMYWITGQGGTPDSFGVAKLLPFDAYTIDQKIDDGFPLSGNVQATWVIVGSTWGPLPPEGVYNPGPEYCVVNGSPSTYELGPTSELCGLVIKAAF